MCLLKRFLQVTHTHCRVYLSEISIFFLSMWFQNNILQLLALQGWKHDFSWWTMAVVCLFTLKKQMAKELIEGQQQPQALLGEVGNFFPSSISPLPFHQGRLSVIPWFYSIFKRRCCNWCFTTCLYFLNVILWQVTSSH